MEPALAHWLNTMHPTPGNTASDRLGDAARAVEPKDTWTPVSADEAERVVRALVDDAAADGTRATASEEPGAKSPSRGRARPKASLAVGALIFLVATVVILTLISRSPAQSGQGMASLAGQAPPHGNPSSPSEAAHHPIQEQEHEMNRATVAAAAAGLIVAGESFAQSAVQWRVEDGGNGHWYQVVTTNPLTWTAADVAARAAGGMLACTEADSETAWVLQQAIARADAWSIAGGNGDVRIGPWLGGYQDQSASDISEPAGGWRWLSGAPVDVGTAYMWLNNSPGCGIDENRLHFWRYTFEQFYVIQDMPDRGFCESFIGPVVSYVIEWSADCNSDGIVDYGQCHDGSLADSNANNVPDCCEQQLPCGGIDFGRQLHLEFAGSCVDSSPYNRDCQATGITYSVSPDGTPGSAASFDGLTSEIQVSGVPIPVNNSFSWALWLRCDQVGIFDQAIVERIEAIGNNLMSPSLFVRPSGALGFGSYSFTSGGTSVESAPETVQPNEWIHVACTSALNGERTVFVNGTAIASGTSADYGQQLGLILIGRDRNDCCTRFRGAIDDLRIYDRCISPSEVVEIFERLPQCNADLTANGTVDGADLGALLAFWGPVNPVFPQADINGDGAVNGADLGVLLSVWGPCGG